MAYDYRLDRKRAAREDRITTKMGHSYLVFEVISVIPRHNIGKLCSNNSRASTCQLELELIRREVSITSNPSSFVDQSP
jgi:hypothetical protein